MMKLLRLEGYLTCPERFRFDFSHGRNVQDGVRNSVLPWRYDCLRLTQLFDPDEFVLRCQLHFEISVNTSSSQKRLDVAGRELNSPSVVGDDRYGFGQALIDAEILIVAQIEPEAYENRPGHEQVPDQQTGPALFLKN